MLTDQERSLLKKFVSDNNLVDEENWAVLGDLFLMVEHVAGAKWFREQYADYPGLREVFQKLLAEDCFLADRFASLKHWHGQAGKIRIVGNEQSERKKQLGIVSAIDNFADAFRNIVARL